MENGIPFTGYSKILRDEMMNVLQETKSEKVTLNNLDFSLKELNSLANSCEEYTEDVVRIRNIQKNLKSDWDEFKNRIGEKGGTDIDALIEEAETIKKHIIELSNEISSRIKEINDRMTNDEEEHEKLKSILKRAAQKTRLEEHREPVLDTLESFSQLPRTSCGEFRNEKTRQEKEINDYGKEICDGRVDCWNMYKEKMINNDLNEIISENPIIIDFKKVESDCIKKLASLEIIHEISNYVG